MRPSTMVRAVSLLVVAVMSSHAQQSTRQGTAPGAQYGHFPLTFETNKGQTDAQVKFLSRGKGYTAFLTAGGMVVSLRPGDGSANAPAGSVNRTPATTSQPATLQFRLVGANQNSVVVGEDLQPGRVNYFIGNVPSKWRTNIPTYSRVRSKNVYPGIDLVYYGNSRQLEYDFQVAAGANPDNIQFAVTGARLVRIGDEGDLILETSQGELRFKSPAVFQEIDGKRSLIGGHYVLRDSNHIAFQVSHYDQNQPLVIDPVMIYSTYLGGSGNDQPRGIAVDSTGNAYIAGFTDSADFPLATLGSLPSGSTHVFVAKIDPTGSNLVYTDYIGGNSQDYGYALALDSANDVLVTGSTASSDFPTVNAYQGTYPGAFNAFLTKLSPTGSSILYSTYLGGNGSDIPSSVAIDGTGSMILAGNTSSTNLPVASAYQATVSPNQGGMYGNYGFLTKFAPDGLSLVYSTYFGGSSNVALDCGGVPCWPQPNSVITGMVLDSSGNAYAAGTTNTYNFPVISGAYLSTNSTPLNSTVGFVSKFNTAGSLQYSTYFYGSSGLLTNINAIAVDGAGSAYVTGLAISDGTFPLTSTSICDPAIVGWGCSYAYVTKFDSTASTLAYSTFLGPNNYANPTSILVDSSDDAYVMASTSSNSFGIVNGIEPYSGGTDVLLAKIDPNGASELWATYIGATLDDMAAAVALDGNGNLYVTGTTNSQDFPTGATPFQGILGGNTDAFVMKIGPASAPSVAIHPATLQFAQQQTGSTSQPQTALLRNMGSSPLTFTSISTTGDFAETDNCGTSVAAAGSCSFSVTFTPSATGHRTGSIILNNDAAGSPHFITLSGDASSGAAAALAPSSLSFANIQLGSSSSAQTVTLSSTGTGALHISSIQVTGDYAQTNNCGSTLAATTSCTINVTFTPTAAGTRNGTLTVTDDAAGSTQSVTLTGAGSDFSLAASPSSNSVKSGSSATYVLTVAALGGSFTNAVSLSCSDQAAKSTCSLSPNSVTPTGNQGTSTLTISTTAVHAQLSPVQPSRTSLAYALWIQLPGFGLLGMILARPKKFAGRVQALMLVVLLTSLILMAGCAGGTGIVNQNPGTPKGTYTISVTGASGSLRHSVDLTLTVQ